MVTRKSKSEVSLLDFVGDRSRPMRVDELVVHDPVLATKDIPSEMFKARNKRSVYFFSSEFGGRSKQPFVKLERIGTHKKKAIWSLDVTGNALENTGLPGESAIRESPSKVLNAIKPNISFASMRPEWMNILYMPRMLSTFQHRVMRRINGRTVNPLYVFGADNRWVFRDASWPWGLVGQIFTSDGNAGTGALIGRNIVVTAGHLVPWNSNSWWMRFVPAYYDGSSLHGTGIESYVSNARGYDVGSDVTGYDWAVLKLYKPLGDWLGYFGYNGYDSDWNNEPYWSIIGYPGAVANGLRPSFQGSISVFDVDGDSNGGKELETRADLTPGNSGGPMFGWWDKDPRLVGVVAGEEEDYSFPFSVTKGNVTAGGSGFTNLCRWARSNW